LLLTDLVSALMLLTRLPVGRFARFGGAANLARSVWAFPVVGLIVNAIGGLVYCAAHRVGMPPLLAAGWTLAATIIITGGLHEDGLADTADGFGGGATPARKMDIMRDSRIGTYGALALVLSVSIRASAIAALGRPPAVATAMIVAGMTGRAGILVMLLLLEPVRGSGMGASVSNPRGAVAVCGLGLAVVVSLLSLPALLAAAVIGFGLGFCVILAKFAEHQIGGYTGDVLGASEVVTECIILTVIASACGGRM
jgi:adenosylcobinamide-GDP ribazoletransferase